MVQDDNDVRRWKIQNNDVKLLKKRGGNCLKIGIPNPSFGTLGGGVRKREREREKRVPSHLLSFLSLTSF